MKNIKTYNEAIRWYKDGKLIPSEESEPIEIKKDHTIILYNGVYYILTDYESITRDRDTSCEIKNFTFYNNKYFKQTLWVSIPSSVRLETIIFTYTKYGNRFKIPLESLPQDVILRISNEIV